MDRFYAFKEKCALRQEARHVQKEANMRERATNAAAKGKKTKAAIFQAFANHHQNKAQYAHFKAENAHMKTSTTCMVIGPENSAKMQVYHHSNVPTTVETGTGPAPEKMPMGSMMPNQQQFFNTYMAGAFPFLQTRENPMQPPAYPPQAPAYPPQAPAYQEKPPAYPSDDDLYPKEPTKQGYPGEAPPPYSGNPEKK